MGIFRDHDPPFMNGKSADVISRSCNNGMGSQSPHSGAHDGSALLCNASQTVCHHDIGNQSKRRNKIKWIRMKVKDRTFYFRNTQQMTGLYRSEVPRNNNAGCRSLSLHHRQHRWTGSTFTTRGSACFTTCWFFFGQKWLPDRLLENCDELWWFFCCYLYWFKRRNL